MDRRLFLTTATAASGLARVRAKPPEARALIAITLDLEMSAQYPRRDMLDWNFEKGNLDEPTKRYALEAARLVKRRGGVIHFFCVGRVLEQANVEWLKEIAALGHPIGNHTYDHVNVKATRPEQTQFRFQRSPWLVRGKTAEQIIGENIRITNEALQDRAGITANGFRTPGGFNNGLHDAANIQKMLRDLGFSWVSSLYPAHQMSKPKEEPPESVYDSIVEAQKQAQPFAYKSGLIEVPMSPISDVTAFRSQYWKRDWFLKAIRLAVIWAIEHRACFDFLAHPSCLVVEDPQFESIKVICDLVKAAGDRAALVGLADMAKRANN